MPPKTAPCIRTLFIIHELCAHERRIPQHITAPLRREHVVPVDAKRVRVVDVRGARQRNPREVVAEFLRDARVHLVVGEPQRDLRDPRGKLLDLDAVELVDVDAHQLLDVEEPLPALALQRQRRAQNLQLQLAQLAVGDDEEVAAAAGRIEERERA